MPSDQEPTGDALRNNIIRHAENQTIHQRVRNYEFRAHDYTDPGVRWCRKKIETLNLWDDDSEEQKRLQSVSLMDVDPCVQEDAKMNDDGLSNSSEMEVDAEGLPGALEAEELIGNPQILPDELGFENEKSDQTDISLRKFFKVMVSPTELGVSMAQKGEENNNVEIQTPFESMQDEMISNSHSDTQDKTNTFETSPGRGKMDVEQDKNTECEFGNLPVNQDPVDKESVEIEAGKEESKSKNHTSFDPSKNSANSHQSIDDHAIENKNHLHAKKLQPYNLEINNHYYNYIYMPGGNNAPENQHQAYQDQSSLVHSPELQALPEPWSKNSHPHSKFVYLFTSYLQLFLNSLLYMGICSLVLMILRAFYHDLKTTWNQEVLKLHYESSVCKFQYFINKCSSQQSPALQAKCLQWGQCMDRDNDQMYVGKTASIAKLIGTMINEMVEPIGWKVVLLLATASYLWIFGLNLMFGFVRAKSYYSGGKRQKPLKDNFKERFSTQPDFAHRKGKNDDQSFPEGLDEPLQRKRIAY